MYTISKESAARKVRILGIFFLLFVLVSVGAGESPAVEPLSSCEDNLNQVDRAKIYYIANSNTSDLYATNEQCYKCSKTFVASGSMNTSCASIWAVHQWTLYLIDPKNPSEVIASTEYTFGDAGEYEIHPGTGDLSIEVVETKQPVDSLLPLIILMVLLVCLVIISFGGACAYKHFSSSDDSSAQNTYSTLRTSEGSQLSSDARSGLSSDLGSAVNLVKAETTPRVQKKKTRVRSLDTFRGFSLTLMIFVNYGAGGYWFLDHTPWNGLTIADLLFPWFMWMMGVSMALSFSSLLPSDTTTNIVGWDVWKRVIRRSLILLGLNIFLNNGYYLGTWRLPGVLAYFSISYFVTSATVLCMNPYTQACIAKILEDESVYQARMRFETEKSFMDVAPKSKLLSAYQYEWLVQGSVLVISLAICLGVQAPGCPRGYNGPGGISDHSAHPDCTGGIHRYIDTQVFGSDHIYDNPVCMPLYGCQTYDPEGLLGSLSACTLTYLGLMSGRILLHFKSHRERLIRWGFLSFMLLLVAGGLCGFSQNEGAIPVNKNLWSTSFMLLSGGSGLVGLSVCYILVDVLKVWSGAPFLYLGMNSILVYCGSGVFEEYFPFGYHLQHQNHTQILLKSCIGVLGWIVVAYYCYKIKFFVKI